jgi:hypothetical protein
VRNGNKIAEDDTQTEMIATQQGLSLETLDQEISRRLQGAIEELFPPLSNVALAHIRDVRPYTRAAIVCTAAATLQRTMPSTAINGKFLDEHALILGSALEMLAVALSIHRLLLLPASGDTLDRALVGSTILTGDYCFSRAASMAAQTESPQVVDLFSRALQQVSEASLRGFFGGASVPWEEDILLSEAGVEAICRLAGADPQTIEQYIALGRAVAARDWQQANAHPLMSDETKAGEATGDSLWRDLVKWTAAITQ